MPIPQTYYLNAPSLSSATAVFYDAALTLCAANGYYSDGLITRQQVGCVLLPEQDCPFCGASCSPFVNINTDTYVGVYRIDANTGEDTTDIGAIVIEFYPNSTPNGILVEFDGSYYNEVSSQDFGYLSPTVSSDFNYLGDQYEVCTFIGSSSPTAYSVYNYDGVAFTLTGGTITISSDASTDNRTPTNPGKCVMVIPKLNNSVNTLTASIATPCNPDDTAIINIKCPTLLPSFKGSIAEDDNVLRCALPTNQTYYVAYVNGSNPFIGLYDWIFTDPYGQNKLADGKYKTNYLPIGEDTMQVKDGVVINISHLC